MFAVIAPLLFVLAGGWLAYNAWLEHNGRMAVIALVLFGLGVLGMGSV
jgi:hypothetical protein